MTNGQFLPRSYGQKFRNQEVQVQSANCMRRVTRNCLALIWEMHFKPALCETWRADRAGSGPERLQTTGLICRRANCRLRQRQTPYICHRKCHARRAVRMINSRGSRNFSFSPSYLHHHLNYHRAPAVGRTRLVAASR